MTTPNNKQYRNTRLFRTETLAEELGLLLQQTQLLAKQVKFEEPDTDKTIILDDKGSLKRATMLKIVEKLTSESYQCMSFWIRLVLLRLYSFIIYLPMCPQRLHSYNADAAAHLKVLFNTYRTYITSKELMDMLLLR